MGLLSKKKAKPIEPSEVPNEPSKKLFKQKEFNQQPQQPTQNNDVETRIVTREQYMDLRLDNIENDISLVLSKLESIEQQIKNATESQ